MATKKLDTNKVEDFYLWGLLTASGGHRICWEINQAMGIDLSRQADIVLERDPVADDAYFSYYNYDDPVNYIRIEMIRNKCSGDFYSRELRNFDYLLMVKGELDNFEAAPFTRILKKLSCLQSILEIEAGKLKNKEILVLE